MNAAGNSSRRSTSNSTSSSPLRKKSMENIDSDTGRRSTASSRSMVVTGERTVKRLRLSKALTVPESTTVEEVCRRMATRRCDAVLVTDSNALLSGIVTDKDIATRVIACELNLENTPISKVMTRNPVFVLSDTLAVEALQKMVQGKFRHLPVIENGEVIALLDIAKCLYDAVARLERAADKGKAIAAAVEGVEKNWGNFFSGTNTFIETLRERMFRPTVSTVITENSKLIIVSPTDTILSAAKKMLEFRLGSTVVTVENKPIGILTSRDILMRVVAQNLSPDSTQVDKVMTPNPECVTVDTSIVDALHLMQDGKFLHLPVVDRDGNVVAIVDAICITHAAVATVRNSEGAGSESTNSMMQKFWDTALGQVDDEEELQSEASLRLASGETDPAKSSVYRASSLDFTFGFKIEDQKGRMHRFNCDTRNLTELLTSILRRIGNDIDCNHPLLITYEDEEHDHVVLASDSDLVAAVSHAKQVGWKSLRLHLDSPVSDAGKNHESGSFDYVNKESWAVAYSAVAAGAALIVGLGVMAYLKKSD